MSLKIACRLCALLCAGWVAADVCADTKIVFYADDIVRVSKTPRGALPDKVVPIVVLKPGDVRLKESLSGGIRRWTSSALEVSLDEKNGRVSFHDETGRLLLAENSDAQYKIVRDGDMRARQSFALEPDEALYGLGLLQNGKLSQRGEKRWLLPENTEDGIPFVQSVRGWAIYWDEISPVRFADDASGMSFESDVCDGIDYYFMFGRSVDGNVAAMRRLTGDVPMMPLWSYGYWQSRERYKTQDELVKVVKDYRQLGIPLDGIIQDWQYWGDVDTWNAMRFNNPGFYDPKKMVEDVHALNARLIISVWCSFGTNTEQYAKLDAMGAIFHDYLTYHRKSKAYDVWSPPARELYWKYLSEFSRYGFDGWWMDSTEPEPKNFVSSDVDKAHTAIDTLTALGPMRRVRLSYPLLAVGNVSERERKAHPERRTFILTRCGCAGQQRYTCNVWSGDIQSTWEALRRQVTAGLGFSLSGLPHYNCDISGFFATPELTPELYVRWMQFGTFLPMMRSHGSGGIKRELNEFCKVGDENYEALKNAIRMRYRLLPYIYSLSHDVTVRRASFLRPLSADFPGDRKTWDLGTEFMFGRAFLVAPVLEKGVRTARPYLPSGADWWDFRTERKHAGGTSPETDAPLDSIPVFVRAGSVVAYGPNVQHVGEKPWDDLEVVVYPGANGRFVLYEDAGDGLGYERGEFSEIAFSWDEQRRTLTIGGQSGSFPGMLKNRQFRIRCVGADPVLVRYDGSALSLPLGSHGAH